MADESSSVHGARSRLTSAPESAMGLVRRLVDEVATLIRQEIALASAEVSHAVREAKAGVGWIASGGAVAFAGLLLLLEALVLGLSERMRPWIAALLVGVIVAAVGLVLLQSGKRKLDPKSLRPARTQESLRRDKELLERRTQ